MTGCFKGCGGTVPYRTRRKAEPRAFCSHCHAHRGEFNSQAKLTAQSVLAIRKAPPPCSLLAVKFGVSQSTITDIRMAELVARLAVREPLSR